MPGRVKAEGRSHRPGTHLGEVGFRKTVGDGPVGIFSIVALRRMAGGLNFYGGQT